MSPYYRSKDNSKVRQEAIDVPQVFVDGDRARIEGRFAQSQSQETRDDGPAQETDDALLVPGEGQNNLSALESQKHVED